jgi:HEAT repeat protein
MGSWRDPRAFEPLMALLDYPDEDIRCGAILALGAFGDPHVVGRLHQLIPAASVEQLLALGEALGSLGNSQGQELLIPLLHHHDAEVRLRAVEALEIVGDLSALPALQLVADHDTAIAGNNYRVGCIACEALATIHRRHE